MKDGRRHLCPACGKHWHCLAENAPRHHGGLPSRPVWHCVYPDALPCPTCAQEGRSDARRAV